MNLSSITSIAASGLQAAQAGLNTVSDNLANVNTTGYVRKVVDQSSAAYGGTGAGVTVNQIQLAANQFLQATSLNAAADSGAATASSSLWDQAQGLFGDPSSDSSFFSSLDQVFSSFSTLSSSGTTPAAQAAAVDQVSSFFDQAQTISGQLGTLSSQADSSISSDVAQANQLLSQIDALNSQIVHASIGGNDATGPEDQQSQLINQLSSLMNIQVSNNPQGGVTIRTSGGVMLAGDGAATLSYDGSGPQGQLSVTSATGATQPLNLSSGEISGYLTMRNTDLPGVSEQLSELVSQTANQLNAIHNQYSAVPPPNQLNGADTGLDLPTAVGGFTGSASVAIVNSSGVVQQQVNIDFTAGTMTVNGTSTSFTPATFLSTLNSELGTSGSASFSNGALSITAASGDGVAVADGSPPSQKAGRDFSTFFGLNNLVSSSTITNYNTGLILADQNGFTPGGQITFAISGANGLITDAKVTVPAAPTTMAGLIAAMNAPVGGVGLYGSFSLNASGELSFTPTPGSGVTIDVAQDDTARGAGGPSISQLFGLGSQIRSDRAQGFSVRSDIAQDPSLLSLASLNLSAPAGTPALAPGDAGGADALSQAGLSTTTFDAAGDLGQLSQTLSNYSASVAGEIATKASAADSAQTAASSISTEANTRLSSVEGVNMDQELIQLTTYQQAYNASARMIQAAKDMYDTLLSMTNS